MYKSVLDKSKPQFEKSLEHFTVDLSSVRTGRANPSLVENVMVESYGAQTPIKGLASISATDSRTLLIQPWDRSLVSAIDKAIQAANLGIQPTNDGIALRLSIPPLNEERRREYVKLIKQYAESARIRVRNIREDVWKEIGKLEKEKKLTEDQKFEAQKELNKLVETFNEKIKEAVERKEQEVMTV